MAADGTPNPTLFCLMPEAPLDEVGEACETLGILGPVTALMGALIALEVLNLLLDGFTFSQDNQPQDNQPQKHTNLVGKQLWIDAKSLRITTMLYGWDSKNPLSGKSVTS